ncbi:MAG: beta-galactosidase [Victivallaceae bacterium]|nr:beta-galactosidase [Victivallaceae bacterium]
MPRAFRGCTRILHGGDYNPDQWLDTPSIIDDDFKFMEMAKCNTFSVGIFSWSALEPEEGKFTFGWLDDIMDRCARDGRKVFLATPTGAKPPWMARKYPECRRVNAELRRDEYMTRHNFCFSSPVAREKTEKIDSLLAERYAGHPALLGWHISNELSGECFCPLCQERFREFLKRRFGTIEELDRRLWAGFWSHRFTSFDEINPLDGTLEGIRVEWKRFCTWQMCDWLAFEKSVVRRYSDAPVTTNMMGLHRDIDYYELGKVCDFISDDCYPMWYSGDEHSMGARFSMLHDMHYAMKDKPFIMMESAPGTPNYREYSHMRRPGELAREMLLAIGHGADGTMYFQWRKGRGGIEKFHGAVVGHDNSPDSYMFRQVAEYGSHLDGLKEIVGSRKVQDVAVLFDWDCHWSSELDFTHNVKNVRGAALAHYAALWEENHQLAVIQSEADFSKYRVVVAPMLFMLKPGVIGRLEKFAKKGGTVVVTHQFGYVNEDSMVLNPREISSLTGVVVDDIDCMEPPRQQSASFNGKSIQVGGVAEYVRVIDADVLGVFEHDFLEDMPAITRRQVGKGTVWYLAANFGPAGLIQGMGDVIDCKYHGGKFDLDDLRYVYKTMFFADCIVPRFCGLPEDVKVSERRTDSARYLFFYNFGEKQQKFDPCAKGTDLWSGAKVSGKLTLPPRGCAVLKTDLD